MDGELNERITWNRENDSNWLICTYNKASQSITRETPTETLDGWTWRCSHTVLHPKTPLGAFLSGWSFHVIVTCVDNVKWLCFGSTAERALRVHASSRHLMVCCSTITTWDRKERPVVFVYVSAFQGFHCGAMGGEGRLYFCWIISSWVWDLIRGLGSGSSSGDSTGKVFFADDWEWLTSRAKSRRGTSRRAPHP